MGEKKGVQVWFRLAGMILTILLVVIVIGHAWWGYQMKRVIAARVAALHAAGEPILADDFETAAPTSDPGNAAPDIEAAIGLVDSDAAGLGAWNKLRESAVLPLRDDERVALKSQVEALRPAIQRLEKARGKSHILRSIHIPAMAMGALYPDLNQSRELVDALGSAALLEHEQHDDAGALAHLRDGMTINRYVSQRPNLIAYLVGVGCAAAMSDKAQQMAPDLNMGNGGVSAETLRAFIDDLMNDGEMKEQFKAALRGERMATLQALELMSGASAPAAGNAAPTKVEAYIQRPLYLRNAAVLMNFHGMLIQIVDEPRLPTVESTIAANMPSGSLNSIASMLAASYPRVFNTAFRIRTDRHLAAAALAIRWYALEHGGALPPSLEALVPGYLSRVPEDPFSSMGAALQYVPNAEEPILYSVGDDRIDGGGSEAPLNPKHPFPGNEWEMKDRVIHLTRQPRPVPPDDRDLENESDPASP